MILGKGLLGGGDNWSNKEKNNFKQECLGQYKNNQKSNIGKLMKKFCDYSADYLSKQGKINQLTENDELAALNLCQYHIRGCKAVDAMEKEIRKNMRY